MGILSDFERRLGGLIEGVFRKAFPTGIQPVELATRILREMEANKTVGVREVWVPNRYVFSLSPADRERFGQTERVLARELQQVVQDGADERGWGLVGPPAVEFETDPGLRQGEFHCAALLVEPATTGGAAAVRGEGAPERASPQPKLVLVEKGRPTRAFPLTRERVIIGRLDESDIVLSDPGASRRHAEVRRESGKYVISDLGSTNGTLVNGRAVGERRLEEGDRISIGKTVLEFRSR